MGPPPLQRHVSTRFGKVSIVTVGVGSVSAPQRRFKKKEMYTAWRLDCGPGRQRSATYVLYLGDIGGASACFLALPQAQRQGASRATRPSNEQRPERRAPATARPEATYRTARRRMIRMAGDRQTAPETISARKMVNACDVGVVRTSSSSRVPTVRTALPSTSSRLALDELVSSLVYRRA